MNRQLHRQPACPAPYSYPFAFLPITYPRRSVTLLDTTLLGMLNLLLLSPFRINTYKTGSKQTTLTTFRMNTYEKQGEGGQVIVNQKSESALRAYDAGIKSRKQIPAHAY